jgi:hypothetical protein
MAFPAAPADLTEFTDANGTVWKYDSTPGMWRRKELDYVIASQAATAGHVNELGTAMTLPPTTTYYGDTVLDDTTDVANNNWYGWNTATSSYTLMSTAAVSFANSTTLSYTGASQNFVVPAGVSAIKVTADGAGSGAVAGDQVISFHSVAAGETLTVTVGGTGGTGEDTGVYRSAVILAEAAGGGSATVSSAEGVATGVTITANGGAAIGANGQVVIEYGP